MKLYMHPASTVSRGVMLLIAEHNLPVEYEVVDILSGAHHQPPFCEINPKRLVPVLDDDGFVLTESTTIIRYLTEKFNLPAWPSDLKERARVNEAMDYLSGDFYRDWGYNLIYPQLFPHHVRQPAEANEATVKWGQTKVKNHLKFINDHMMSAGNKYLRGNDMTAADYALAGILSLGEIVRADYSEWPNVAAYYANLKARPAWNKVNEVLMGFAGAMKDKPFINLS